MNRMLIGVSANLAALVGLLAATVFPSGSTASNGGGRHFAPINLHEHISSDGSGMLRLSGVGTPLGRFSGHGTIDSSIFDPITNGISVGVTATFVAHNGDRLFASVTVSVDVTSGQGTESLIFTGGTGRFAGCSGQASGHCEAILNAATPLMFECDGRTSGTLHLAH